MFYFECVRAFGMFYRMTFTCNKSEIGGNQELTNSFCLEPDNRRFYFEVFQEFDKKTCEDFCQYDFDI